MQLVFLIKEGILSFKRARLAAVISVMTIALSLFLMAVFGLMVDSLSNVFKNFYQKVQLEVFVDPSLSSNNVKNIENRIAAIPGVLSIEFRSPEIALQEFEQDFGAGLIGVLDENPLPPSFRLVLKPEYSKINRVDQIASAIKAINGVDDVLYQKEIVRLLDKYFWVGVIVAGTFGSLIVIITTLLIFNTIRLSIHARRGLIEIMRQVGATNLFIKGPFIFEGILQGMLGGLIACGVVWFTGDVFRILLLPDLQISPRVYLSLFGGGIVLGWIGSYISVNKYLKY